MSPNGNFSVDVFGMHRFAVDVVGMRRLDLLRVGLQLALDVTIGCDIAHNKKSLRRNSEAVIGGLGLTN